MITQMKKSIYVVIQTEEKLLEGLLFLRPSGGKYLKEGICTRHARASLTLKHITPPPSPHPSTVPRFIGLYHFRCGVASRNDARFRPIGFIRDDSEWKGELLIRGTGLWEWA